MRRTGFFITGTDTGIGKTWATLALMRALRARGLCVLGMKPVATGGIWREGRLVNDDALVLRAAASIALPYEQVNPYIYEPPVSPHIAAALADMPVDLDRIVKVFNGLPAADCVLVEGVGGWAVPLDGRRRVADLAVSLGLPVILVVGLRLGCLNHALLSHAAILSSGVEFAGWVANQVEPGLLFPEENIATLTRELGVPPLAVLPCGDGEPPLVPWRVSCLGPA